MEVKFKHAVLDGTPYEAGRQQGGFLVNIPEALDFMLVPASKMDKDALAKAEKAIEFHEKYCPGLNDEIRGFTDSLGAKQEQAAYYHFPFSRAGCCSHMAILPSLTADGHTYAGRSYEWSTEDELRLCTARLQGKAAHMGFSVFQFGRFDGLNEFGLSATMSSAVPGSNPEGEGCMFWSVIRTLLDRSKTVDDAINIVMDIPTCFNWNLILADRQGRAALVEIAGTSKKQMKMIDAGSPDQYIHSTNHYTLPGMKQYDTKRMANSVERYDAISRGIGKAPKVDAEVLRSILSKSLPDGVCCHYYSDWLGTLWSMIFDLTEIGRASCRERV
jgi:predicted choloylglycine hydrolase